MKINLLDKIPQIDYDNIADDIEKGRPAVFKLCYDGCWCSPYISTIDHEYHWKYWSRVNAACFSQIINDPSLVKVTAVKDKSFFSQLKTMAIGGALSGGAALYFLGSPKIAGFASLLGAAVGKGVDDLYKVEPWQDCIRKTYFLVEQKSVSALSLFTYTLPESGSLHWNTIIQDSMFVNKELLLSGLQHVLEKQGVLVVHRNCTYLELIKKGTSLVSLPLGIDAKTCKIAIFDINDMYDRACAVMLYRYGFMVFNRKGVPFVEEPSILYGKIIIRKWDNCVAKIPLYNSCNSVASLDATLNQEVVINGSGKIPITERRFF